MGNPVFFLLSFLLCFYPPLSAAAEQQQQYVSAVGDPGMRRDGLGVAFEAWNFCNEVGKEAPNMGSPRAADCFDITSQGIVAHKVTEEENRLGVGTPFPGITPRALNNSDLYAVEKELFLGSKCEVQDSPKPWQFWMVMLKSGNLDTTAALCPENGRPIGPFKQTPRFPCFGKGCMNQPAFYHEQTRFVDGTTNLRGSFNGSYESGADLGKDGVGSSNSLYEVVWEKKAGAGSWVFSHRLKTSERYPWLMLYLRADAAAGFSGGYHYETRGMLKTLPESPNFKVRLTLDVKQGGGTKSQFYLMDIGSCWKNDGSPCDGDVLTDVTRYSEMIINPQTPAWCSPTNLAACPPFHITPNNNKIHRNDTANFPYSAYHYYCGPGTARYMEKPFSTCDPYSNPQAQELVQLLPHPVWAEYGYPSKKGEGWVGDPRTWELDVGGLSSRLYFYQDPGTPAARRIWTSLDVGTEIFISDQDEIAEWTLTDFDVLIPSPPAHLNVF
ncbi:uncharacterized protein LOC116254035 [Nymphaea colorata]|nr:uncharacterized protein LOC116254035 [Nymphaea colorata]